MKYTVEWNDEANADLARIWLQHQSESVAINEAVNRIERELKTDAHRKGVPIDNYRCYVDPPIKVLFIAIPDDNLAQIVEARWVGP